MIEVTVKLVLSYLLGSVSGSMLMGRIKNVDIRTMGSGNAGGTNAFRTQGFLFALAAIIIDLGKAVIAVAVIAPLAMPVADAEIGIETLMLLSGFCVVVGHCYPIFHGFRGGKGAATAVGALIIIKPVLLIPMIITWLLVLGISGFVGLATVLAGLSLIPAAMYFDSSTPIILFTVAIAIFMTFTHRSNLSRLKYGTENRFEKARFSRWFRD
ncbi:MAG: glycerol-3-phosphate acyltransferase PlsY [Lysobacterales bacterium]|jgi:glycerol-3-phosphate acyltransferase PlsY